MSGGFAVPGGRAIKEKYKNTYIIIHILYPCMHTHTHIHAHMHKCAHMHECAHMHAHASAHMHTYLYVHITTYTHTYPHRCICYLVIYKPCGILNILMNSIKNSKIVFDFKITISK